jgi:membrane protein involved in colicin uptake
MKSPLATLKDKFGDKAKLVAELEKLTKDEDLWVARVNKSKGLAHVSNAKLMKLQATFAAVKEKFGTRAKLIDAICEIEKRKDEGYKTRLGNFPVPRLWDMYRSAAKRAGAGAKDAEKAAKKKAAAPKKAAAAKAAAPKAAAKKTAAKKG